MKFKLNENIGGAGAEILSGAGHDVSTVREQQLSGVADDLLLHVCIRENRSLVTLDRGIGRTFSLSGSGAVGVAVLDIGAPRIRAQIRWQEQYYLSMAQLPIPKQQLTKTWIASTEGR